MNTYRTLSEVLQKQDVFLGPATVKLLIKNLNIKTSTNNEVVKISTSEKEVLKSLVDMFVELAGPIATKPVEQFIH